MSSGWVQVQFLSSSKFEILLREKLNVINVKRIISDNLQPFYMVLESLGFYKKPTLCIYESTGYSKEENEQWW